ncbi:MAG TPA: tetratricopeptide repeat protein [Candidatus Melainabacteria bacterium]|nr:tetratricopeptide repeat protein [Candidatus Melainabacteria bacterium]
MSKGLVTLILAVSFTCSTFSAEAQSYNARWAAYINQGGICMEKKEYKKAEAFFERSLLESKSFGNRSKEMASSINALAGVHMEQKHWKEAESYLVLALSMREDLLSERDPRIANTCFNLGVCCYKQDKLSEAGHYFERALDTRYSYKSGKPEDPHIAEELIWLSRVYARQGRQTDAIEVLEQALSIKKKKLGSAHADIKSLEIELDKLKKNAGGRE